MNRKVFVLLLAGFASLGVPAQQKTETTATPPVSVKTAFEKKFSGASKVKWEKEDNDYEVNFVFQKKEMSAVFDNQGTWKETEEEIKVTELPVAAMTYIKSQYKGAKIKEAAKITKAGGGINYEAEINKKDVLFDEQGRFIREEKD
ncbi:MAG: PepSY-like domain-containing protein [Chitinophagaceae bacterium]